MNNPLLIFALGWLALLALGANAGIPVPDGFGLAIIGLTLASIVYPYVRLCRRWPVFAWAGLGLLAGLFGGGYYSHHNTTTVVEREYDDSDCVDHDGCNGI
jgi:hypothetical protein